MDNVIDSNPSVKKFLKNECWILLANQNITEGIESALPYGSGEEGTDIILELIQNIANIADE